MNRASLFAGVVVLALGMGVAPASAAQVEIVPWHDQGGELWVANDPDICNGMLDFDIQHDWDVSGTDRITFRNGLYQFSGAGRGWESFTANGHTFTGVYVWNSRDAKVVDNGDGTLSITGRWSSNNAYSLDGTALFRDAGLGTATFLVDDNGTPSDPDDDTFLYDVDPFVFHGRADTDGRDFCEDLDEFLQ